MKSLTIKNVKEILVRYFSISKHQYANPAINKTTIIRSIIEKFRDSINLGLLKWCLGLLMGVSSLSRNRMIKYNH